MSLAEHLEKSGDWDKDVEKHAENAEKNRTDFIKELKEFKTLLDKQLGQSWPEPQGISTWSLPQLLLRVVFNGKDEKAGNGALVGIRIFRRTSKD